MLQVYLEEREKMAWVTTWPSSPILTINNRAHYGELSWTKRNSTHYGELRLTVRDKFKKVVIFCFIGIIKGLTDFFQHYRIKTRDDSDRGYPNLYELLYMLKIFQKVLLFNSIHHNELLSSLLGLIQHNGLYSSLHQTKPTTTPSK